MNFAKVILLGKAWFVLFEGNFLYAIGEKPPSGAKNSALPKGWQTWIHDFPRNTLQTVQVPNLSPEGTEFQKKVWRELLRIPPGETRTYLEIARAVGSPRAARAVGSACKKNPIPFLIPCHRVVPSSGGVGQYLFGSKLKERLLKEEKSCKQSNTG